MIDKRYMHWKHVLQEMFVKQRALMRRFAPVEGLPSPEHPMLMTIQFSQDVARKLAWHVTEELTEAANAGPPAEILEELTDAFHYLVELCIYVGITYEQLFNFISTFPVKHDPMVLGQPGEDELSWAVVKRLGTAMQCLKLRPWRTVTSNVDMETFTYQITAAFYAMTKLWAWYGVVEEDLYEQFCKKSDINHTRLDHTI